MEEDMSFDFLFKSLMFSGTPVVLIFSVNAMQNISCNFKMFNYYGKWLFGYKYKTKHFKFLNWNSKQRNIRHELYSKIKYAEIQHLGSSFAGTATKYKRQI